MDLGIRFDCSGGAAVPAFVMFAGMMSSWGRDSDTSTTNGRDSDTSTTTGESKRSRCDKIR